MNVNWEQVFETIQYLETERCILRPPRLDDASAILDLMGDENVTRYLGRFPLSSLESAAELIEKYIRGHQEKNRVTWIIVGRENGEVMGMSTFFNLLHDHFRAELGYALTPQWWGRGIMSEVIPVVLDYGFDKMQLHSVMAQIDPENDASRHLLEKYHFVQEAYFQEDFYHPVLEKFTDTVIFSLLKAKWENR